MSPDIRRIIERYRLAVHNELLDHNRRVLRRMTTERLSGAGPASLATRSGQLRRSLSGGVTSGASQIQRAVMGIGGGVPYARVQERGGTIKAKQVKNLAIPLSPARTKAGVKKYSGPRQWPKPLKLITSRSGKKLLVETKFRSAQVDGGGFTLHFKKEHRQRHQYKVILPGGKKQTVRLEPVKPIYLLQPSVVIPPRLGLRQVFRQEAAETFRRIRSLKSSIIGK
jgi:hypothetical protein